MLDLMHLALFQFVFSCISTEYVQILLLYYSSDVLSFPVLRLACEGQMIRAYT